MLMKYKVSILQKRSQSVSQPIQYKFHIAKKKKKSAFPSKQSKPLVPRAFKPCFFDPTTALANAPGHHVRGGPDDLAPYKNNLNGIRRRRYNESLLTRSRGPALAVRAGWGRGNRTCGGASGTDRTWRRGGLSPRVPASGTS